MRYLLIYILAILPMIAAGKVTVHRALVIGLGEQEDTSWAKINGDNDVRYAVRFLEEAGYTDIRTLVNSAATKKGIVDAFTDLCARCQTGDKVYIHYSGHGQLMTDIDGDEALKWTGYHADCDESWIPYDAYMVYCDHDHGDKHLCDDELAVLLSAIRDKIGPRGQLIVAVDACHSGDATCGIDDECVRGVSKKFNIPAPVDVTPSEPVKERWLTVSACRQYQLSTEIPNLRVGRLTYALYSLGANILNANRRDIERLLNDFMLKHQGRTPQNPMVTGTK